VEKIRSVKDQFIMGNTLQLIRGKYGLYNAKVSDGTKIQHLVDVSISKHKHIANLVHAEWSVPSTSVPTGLPSRILGVNANRTFPLLKPYFSKSHFVVGKTNAHVFTGVQHNLGMGLVVLRIRQCHTQENIWRTLHTLTQITPNIGLSKSRYRSIGKLT
jgi:hypothetical protein